MSNGDSRGWLSLLVIDGPEQVCVRLRPVDLALAMGMDPGLVIPSEHDPNPSQPPCADSSALIPPEGWHIRRRISRAV